MPKKMMSHSGEDCGYMVHDCERYLVLEKPYGACVSLLFIHSVVLQ